MNHQRRKKTAEIITRLEGIKDELELLLSEEQEYYDNMPESLQSSDRGNTASEAIENYEAAFDGIQEVNDYLSNITC